MKFNTPTYNPMSYKPKNSAELGSNAMAQASSSYSKMGQNAKSETEGPGKTVGGGLQAGVGGAAGGAVIGASMAAGSTAAASSVGGAAAGGAASGSAGGYWGAAIGAVVGIAAYLLS